MSKIFQYILITVTIVCLVFLFFRKPQQIFKTTPIKIIETRVENNKGIVDSIVIHQQTVRNEITHFKTVKDTVKIIKYQDSLITILDTQIVVMNTIIKDQDTIIDLLEFDNKRLKRQRNISFIVNGVLTSFLIMK